jgi:hypothetical protein
VAFLTLKKHLGRHLWWNSKVSGILQQVWACLIIAQVLQAVRLEIACRAHVDPFEVSLPQTLAQGADPIALCVQRGRQLGFIRPSSRTQLQVPVVTRRDITPAPTSLVLHRQPGYPADPGLPGPKASNKKKQPKQQAPPQAPTCLTPELYACLVP